MKKVMKAAALSVALMGLGMNAAMAETNIAVVNLGEVFQKLPQRAASDAQLKKEFEPRSNELKKLEKEGSDLVAKYQKDASFMSKEQKAQSQEKLQKLQAEYQQKRQAFERDFGKRKAEENQKMMTAVKSAVDAVAKEGGYDLILDQQAAPFSSSKLDVTAKIITKASK